MIVLFLFFSGKISAEDNKKEIKFNDNGLFFYLNTSARTVADFLAEQKINLEKDDFIFPDKEADISSGSEIIFKRAKKISVLADGKETKATVFQGSVIEAIHESQINLGEDDLVLPKRTSPVADGIKIEITRVKIEGQIIQKALDFKNIAEEDDKLSWRTKKIKQKGVKGLEELKYKVVSHNDKEISRKLLDRKTVKEPVPEIAVQGTYVKTGKAHTGLGTWYAFRGGMFAANPWLPMGSYVKVTNKENGKSVIVQINDRGPFGKNRIIDLDKVAFQKIASLGAGVIDVKVEEILN